MFTFEDKLVMLKMAAPFDSPMQRRRGEGSTGMMGGSVSAPKPAASAPPSGGASRNIGGLDTGKFQPGNASGFLASGGKGVTFGSQRQQDTFNAYRDKFKGLGGGAAGPASPAAASTPAPGGGMKPRRSGGGTPNAAPAPSTTKAPGAAFQVGNKPMLSKDTPEGNRMLGVASGKINNAVGGAKSTLGNIAQKGMNWVLGQGFNDGSVAKKQKGDGIPDMLRRPPAQSAGSVTTPKATPAASSKKPPAVPSVGMATNTLTPEQGKRFGREGFNPKLGPEASPIKQSPRKPAPPVPIGKSVANALTSFGQGVSKKVQPLLDTVFPTESSKKEPPPRRLKS